VSAFANLSIARKLMAAFVAVVVVIFASSAIVYGRLLVIERAKNWRVRTADVLETLENARDAMVDAETGVRGYLITGDENFLEPYHRSGNAYTAAVQKLRDLATDNPVLQRRVDELNELAKKWRSGIAEREIALMAKPETREDARALEGLRAGKTAMDMIRAKVDEIEGGERELLAKRGAVQEQAFATAYTMTILGGAASLIIATLMGVLLTRGIAAPITRMTSAMSALAKGDNTVEVPRTNRSDEIGAMAAAVQIFKDSMIERDRAQTELAHVNRVTTMGELTASIAHEVNQPLVGVVANAEAGLRWLDREIPDLAAARRSLEWIIDDGNRASEVIRRIRALANKTDIEKVPLDVNDVIKEVIALMQGELISHQVLLRMEFAPALPMVLADRVQLQQVIINLLINGIEAMQSLTDRPRELVIRSGQDEMHQVLVSIADCGVGITAQNADRVFNAFFTTKSSGMGMGLSICRSIMEAHGGQLWATANVPYGAAFQFTLPANADTTS
jgi:signal transduction histidine kinase